MQMNVYKSGQGYNTRLFTALTLFLITASGCFVLYNKLAVYNIWVQTLVPAGLCAVLGFVIFWLVNKPNLADFMISAEGEIKKVSWSSKKEIITSTCVVIVVVFSMALMLWLVDMGFQLLFRYVIDIY